MFPPRLGERMRGFRHPTSLTPRSSAKMKTIWGGGELAEEDLRQRSKASLSICKIHKYINTERIKIQTIPPPSRLLEKRKIRYKARIFICQMLTQLSCATEHLLISWFSVTHLHIFLSSLSFGLDSRGVATMMENILKLKMFNFHKERCCHHFDPQVKE